jgi:hypothetical protein
MPAADTHEDRRGGKLLVALFWVGMALAPVAALLLLLGQSAGSLRIAAVLAVIAVVMIGLSITLRRDAESVRIEMEEVLLDEIDMLRDDVREDIATATRASHRSLTEKLQAMQVALDQMRAQLNIASVGLGRPDGKPVPPGATQRGVPGQAPPGGVVRHTETVQVTTRSTIVDPHAEEAARAGHGYGGQPGRRSAERRRGRDAGEAADRQRADQERVTGVRSGDRWASVRTDDRGRELRMGERRSAVHSDESGTEMRVEDRWAAVRREGSRGSGWVEGSEEAESPFWSDSWDEEPEGDEERSGRRGRRSRALPAAPSEPASSWTQRYGQGEPEPERERRGRRSRDDDERNWR